MEIQGKVIQILPIQTGIGKSGNNWANQQFVIETFDQYPRKVIIDIFGEDRIKNNPVDMDQKVEVSYDLESREFNGRWYTSVRAWKVKELNNEQEQAQTTQTPQESAPLPFESEQTSNEESSDLPF